MLLNLRPLLLAACIATSIAEAALVHSNVPRTEGVDDLHVVGDVDVEKGLPTPQDAASPRFVQLDTSDMVVRTQARTDRRPRRFKSRNTKAPDGPGISSTCRNRADLTAALAAAYDLAHRARENTNIQLWKQFMNGDAAIQQQVYRIYTSIMTFIDDPRANPYGITITCDYENRSRFCSKYGERFGLTKKTGDHTSTITLCRPFFTELTVARSCDDPIAHRRMEDQGGALLHELLHCQTLTQSPRQIEDGPNRNCYDVGCVEALARVEAAGPSPPWIVAASYEYYAFAVRAKSCLRPRGGLGKSPFDMRDRAELVSGVIHS